MRARALSLSTHTHTTIPLLFFWQIDRRHILFFSWKHLVLHSAHFSRTRSPSCCDTLEQKGRSVKTSLLSIGTRQARFLLRALWMVQRASGRKQVCTCVGNAFTIYSDTGILDGDVLALECNLICLSPLLCACTVYLWGNYASTIASFFHYSYPPNQGDLQNRLVGHSGPIFSLKWNKSGELLVTSSVDGSAVVWEPHTGLRRQTFSFHSGMIIW